MGVGGASYDSISTCEGPLLSTGLYRVGFRVALAGRCGGGGSLPNFLFFFVFCSLLPSCTEFPRSYEVIDYGPFSFRLIGPLALTTNGGSTYNECQRFQKSKQMKATSH